MNYYPYFSHLLPFLGEIRNETSAHNGIEHCELHENWRKAGGTFLMRVNDVTLTCLA